MYRKSVLKNGLRVVSHEIKERDSVSVGIWCGTGGRFESDEIKGAAHFLEHILFKGSRKYSCDEIKMQIEGVGGSLNAFTSEEQTCYLAKVPALHVSKTFDVLADMVFCPRISHEDVEKERGVILEEIKMYHDLPQYFVVEELERLMWPDHPLGKGLAGTADSVSQLTDQKLKDFHTTQYIPNNIVLSACGNISHQALVDLARKKTSAFGPGTFRPAEPFHSSGEGDRMIFHHRPIEQMHLALGMPGMDHFDPGRYALNLLNVVVGGNMSSRLFDEVREKRGLAYSIYSSAKSLADTGLFVIRAGVENTRITQTLEVVLQELDKICRDGITPSEFKRAKKYLTGQLLLGLEDTMEHMLWIGESTMIRDRIRTLDEVMEAIKKVRIDDVRKAAQRVFQPQEMRLAVVGPIKPEQERQIRSLMG